MSTLALPLPRPRWRRPLPGFGLSLGLGMAWLGVVVLLPLTALTVRAAGLGLDGWLQVLRDERVLAALKVSFGTAFVAAVIALLAGALVAWVLVRYRFPGRRLLDALVDLPFALPTAVAGIALTAIYAPNGWIGRFLEPLGIQVAYQLAGIVIALVFIGLPFTVRTVQPILESLGADQEQAAASLGASRFTALRRVVLPEVLPALLTGFSLAFARGLGEYGSVIFIAGNKPYQTEIAPLLITIRLEEYDYNGAVGLAAVMLAASFLCLLAINLIPLLFRHERRSRRDG
ncbi:sulfate ABC transporter permease subunit CysT [Luteimonas sp. M1R5S18]|jgi:sulfate transport system permease protein|uniref:Sulfate transport system permease protein CysT n=1 Tax=Luteimonas rhizosphaericola TaxID=3042024 RepID=A0ABT6JMG2_9GAMM|nr:sulfate ABC transporter permease subunit CysT [Luteimonas rhizosphaericola]MDH5831186.1 sulfate ABC transporter permease subunit CysT [Luteimonas rhizosphaericola]